VSLLHFTRLHAQLLPVYFREPSTTPRRREQHEPPAHIVGEAL